MCSGSRLKAEDERQARPPQACGASAAKQRLKRACGAAKGSKHKPPQACVRCAAKQRPPRACGAMLKVTAGSPSQVLCHRGWSKGPKQ
eukprot:3597958-Amphidinium_carterae.1